MNPNIFCATFDPSNTAITNALTSTYLDNCQYQNTWYFSAPAGQTASNVFLQLAAGAGNMNTYTLVITPVTSPTSWWTPDGTTALAIWMYGHFGSGYSG